MQVTVATQTGHESPDLAFNPDKMTTDGHCYECKVRYKDPKPQDLVMYLHAWKYKVSESGRKLKTESHVRGVRAERPDTIKTFEQGRVECYECSKSNAQEQTSERSVLNF